MSKATERKPDAHPPSTRRSEREPQQDDEMALREALAIALGWRRAPAVALSEGNEKTVEPVRISTGSAPTIDRRRSILPENGEQNVHSRGLPGSIQPARPAAHGLEDDREGWIASPTFDFGGMKAKVLAEYQNDVASEQRIPSTVIDTVLREIVEANFAVWYVWHVPTAYCQAPGLEELLHMSPAAVPTFTEEWFGLIHPEDLPRVVAENDRALRAISSFRSEYRLRRSDGEYVRVSDSAIVLSGSDGQAQWMAGGIRDITVDKALADSQMETAQLHKALFKKAPMPAVVIDGAGLIADANQAALEFFAVDHTGLVGQEAADVLPSSLFSHIVHEIRAGQSEDREREAREVNCETSGGKKWLLATVVLFQTSSGQRVFLLGADLTESRRVSDALARSEKSLFSKTQALEERNVALKVLVDQRRDDLDALKESIIDNVQQLVVPTLNLLADALSGRPERALVDAVRLTMDDITRPMLARPDGATPGAQSLSRREYQVLQLIKAGRTSEQIADALCLSPTTVTFHRSNIRRKMGLHGTGKRLAAEVIVKELV